MISTRSEGSEVNAMKNIASLLLGLLLVPALAASQSFMKDETAMREATAAANASLATFARLADEIDYRALGFDSADQVRAASLGAPIAGYAIRLDELREYEGGDARPLLHESDRLTFPVLSGGSVRSGLTVVRRQDRWEAESLGGPAYTRLLAEGRDQLIAGAGGSGAQTFEVQVPALGIRFAGSLSGGSLLLAPVADDPRFGFERGVALPAETALTRLVPAAREHNGLPM
jgi:hypothetical protein